MRSIKPKLIPLSPRAATFVALTLLLSCRDVVGRSGVAASGWRPVGVAREVTLEPVRPAALGGSTAWMTRLTEEHNARDAAVATFLSAPSRQSSLALAHSYFSAFAETHAIEGGVSSESSRSLTVKPAGTALTIATRGHVFRVESAGSLQWSGEVAMAEEGHFLAPTGPFSSASDAGWKTSRIEEYWVRTEAAGEQRAEYDVTLPAEVRQLHDAGNYLEFLDAAGVAVLRFHPSVVRDAQGRVRTGLMELSGVTPGEAGRFTSGARIRLATSVSLTGLSAPLVVDPGWSSTASMADARFSHTSTLLPSGKLLVTGGFGNTGILTSAELYDSGTQTWTAAASLATARSDHTATLLPTGKLLVAGGHNFSAVLDSAELYDPATDTWSAAGTLSTARHQHTAALLKSGKVLVAGGSPSGSNATVSAELYDPATNTWSAAGSMIVPHTQHAGAVLDSGKVLVVGGQDDGYQGLAEAEVYDPAMDTWTVAGALSDASYALTATLLPGGQVLVAGGWGSKGPTTSATLYDPAANSWTAAASLKIGRWTHTATLLATGQVLVAGGANHNGYVVASTELYDPGTNTWTIGADMQTSRQYHGASLLSSGQVLVSGGNGNAIALANVDVYGLGAPTLTAPADGATVPPTFTVAGTAQSGATVTVLDGGAPVTTLTAGNDGTFSGSVTLSAGAHTLTATQTVNADTSAPSAAIKVTVVVPDTVPPTLMLPDAITTEATDATGANVTFTATALDAVDGSVSVTCTPASGTHFPDGKTTVSCSAQDAAMNKATGTFQVTVTRTAITAPALVSPADGAKLTSGAVAFSWTASTAPMGVSVSYKVESRKAGATVVTQTSTTTSLTLSAADALPAGNYTWQVTAIDSRDNKGVTSPTGAFSVVASSSSTTGKKSGGCGCGSTGGLENAGLLLLGLAALRSRRSVRA